MMRPKPVWHLASAAMVALAAAALFISALATPQWIRYDVESGPLTTHFWSGVVQECSSSEYTRAEDIPAHGAAATFSGKCRFLPFYCEPGNQRCRYLQTVQSLVTIAMFTSVGVAFGLFVLSFRNDMCQAFVNLLIALAALTAACGVSAMCIAVAYYAPMRRDFGASYASAFAMLVSAWALEVVAIAGFGLLWRNYEEHRKLFPPPTVTTASDTFSTASIPSDPTSPPPPAVAMTVLDARAPTASPAPSA